jgi:NitT/TauT family transport system substrate-binding protein
VLAANGLDESDYTLEFKSEATEVAAVLAEDSDAIGVIPQPFVTAALMQNDALSVALDLNEEWKKVTPETPDGMVTGVTVVRKVFLEEHPDAVYSFLEEHEESASAINADPATGATLAVSAGIVAKEPIAEKAIPQCNITCIQGDDMEADLSAYLDVLADFNAELIGGTVPDEAFYLR